MREREEGVWGLKERLRVENERKKDTGREMRWRESERERERERERE